jgi:DNA-binding XRE family transcriptional regulator
MDKTMNGDATTALRAPRPKRGGLLDQLGRKNRLKELRMKAMLSQLELSRRSGVSPWTICKIEHGQRLPQIGVAYLLARTLGVSIEDIFYPESISILPVSGRDGR